MSFSFKTPKGPEGIRTGSANGRGKRGFQGASAQDRRSDLET